MTIFRVAIALAFAAGGATHVAAADDVQKTAAIFGARPDIETLALSPDGSKVAYLKPDLQGQGSAIYVRGVEEGAKPVFVEKASGAPDRLTRCDWVANDRLICEIYGVVRAARGLVPFTRLFAINIDGSNFKMLSTQQNTYSQYAALGGGRVIDWLPDEDGNVLMLRTYVPDAHLGSRAGSEKKGVAVDLVNTRTLEIKTFERPDEDAASYITDGRGAIRIKSRWVTRGDGLDLGRTAYFYRLAGTRPWLPLSEYNRVTQEGFRPIVVDHDRNLAYGFQKTDGRIALYTMALDGSMKTELVGARPDVDVDRTIRIGRRERVVGFSYATDIRSAVYTDPDFKKLANSLGKALAQTPILRIVDSSVDESKLLIYAGADNDPGAYYLFDRTAKTLKPLTNLRDALLSVPLAHVKPITYPASDGTMVPAYLTLPPGKESAKGLPAVVLPHGGPSARDEWGFDWLSQFFAARGYAVLQPNFRGSDGYGDAWFRDKGFKAWKVAIGDVDDAGKWLVTQGIADPAKLAIVGWSYGGYAALQSGVAAPGLFKAVVAIAPVTDLGVLRNSMDDFTVSALNRDFIGQGPHVREGSPAQNADRIKAPVLMFHGTTDFNVAYFQSETMAAALKAAHARYELVTFPGLDHYLDDSKARADMLAKIDAFLHSSMGF